MESYSQEGIDFASRSTIPEMRRLSTSVLESSPMRSGAWLWDERKHPAPELFTCKDILRPQRGSDASSCESDFPFWQEPLSSSQEEVASRTIDTALKNKTFYGKLEALEEIAKDPILQRSRNRSNVAYQKWRLQEARSRAGANIGEHSNVIESCFKRKRNVISEFEFSGENPELARLEECMTSGSQDSLCGPEENGLMVTAGSQESYSTITTGSWNTDYSSECWIGTPSGLRSREDSPIGVRKRSTSPPTKIRSTGIQEKNILP